MKSSIKKIALYVQFVVAFLFLAGCSKDDGSKPVNRSHKIVFKAEASTGSRLNMIVYGYDASLTTLSSLNQQTWTSPEITAPANATVASIATNAVGANATATLKLQIFVDGVLQKEGTSTGTALSATAQYNLK